jgi:hypothetical protein
VSGSGGDFGPVAPAAGEGPPFAVAGPSAVTLDAARSASVSFTVSNVSGRPVRARVLVLPGAGADASWFSVVGESERALPVAGTTIVDVAVKVSEKAPAGAASFVLGAALEEAPDRVVSSPTVSVQVPPPKPKPFPWWIVIVAVVALLLLVGGGILIWSLTRPDDAPPTESPSPSPSPTPTFASGAFAAIPDIWFDLDTNRVVVAPGVGEDIYFYQGAGSGELGVVGQGPPRLAVVDEPTFEACVAATDYDDVNLQNVLLLPDRTTHVCVRFTDQGRRSLMTIGPASGAGLPVSFVTWERG